MLVGVTPHVANCYASFFRQFFDSVGHLLTTLGGQRWYVQPNDASIIVRSHSQLTGDDGFGNGIQSCHIKRANHDLLRLRNADIRNLLQRRRRSVKFDSHRIHKPRVSAPGANSLQGVAEYIYGLFHTLFRVHQDLVLVHVMLPVCSSGVL